MPSLVSSEDRQAVPSWSCVFNKISVDMLEGVNVGRLNT